jgi:Aconitase family (aconitate hydratase)
LPGKLLIGSDSHTCAAGSLGMLAIGVGGLDAAMATAGEPLFLTMPEIWGTSATVSGVAPCISGRTGGPIGTSGTPSWASRCAQSGGAHTRTCAPSSRNRTASATSGSTSPRPPYVVAGHAPG